MAFHSFRFDPGDRILTAEAEYASNYISYLRLKERQGIEVVTVPSTSEGELDVAALERLIDERVKLISVSHVPTNGGLVNPAAEIGRVARAAGSRSYSMPASRSANSTLMSRPSAATC